MLVFHGACTAYYNVVIAVKYGTLMSSCPSSKVLLGYSCFPAILPPINIDILFNPDNLW